MIGFNLFMAACMWLFLPIVYVTMKNNTVCKNNLILSVTLPPEAQGDPEVLDYCRRFKKRLLRNSLLLTAALLPAIPMPSISFSMTWSMVWFLIALVVILRTYGRAYEDLKAIKGRRGWQTATAGQVIADLKPLTLPKPLKTAWFVPPMVLSALPAVSCFLGQGDAARQTLLAITAGMNLLITTMSLVFYGLIFRQRKDILDGDTALTAALTRVRRYNWTKMWLVLSWATALYSLAVWACGGNMAWYYIWTGVYCAVLVFAALATEFAARRAQQRLTQGRTQTPLVDEDDYWIWGQFYYNPHSTKAMINERVGMGMSMNFAHPLGKATAVFMAVLLLAMPLVGVSMIAEELSPIRAELTQETLTVSQTFTKYEIALEEITFVKLLEELPAATRTWGTGMPNLLKGNFYVEGYGACKLCLDPTAPPFLLVKTAETTYILGPENAQAVYAQLS